MQKPPPDRETVVQNLIQFRADYSKNSLTNIEFLDDAVKALDEPQTIEQLAEKLNSQSSTIEAAGWVGVANNMRKAARKLSWFAARTIDWRAGLNINSAEDLGKALCVFIDDHRTKLERHQIEIIGSAARDLLGKPKEPDSTEHAAVDVEKLLHTVQTCVGLARRHAVFPNRREDINETLRLVKKASGHLNAAIKKLDVAALLRIGTAESLING